MLEQAEGGVVAEVAAALHLNEDANATAAKLKQAEARLVAKAAAAARHSIEVTNTAAAEMEQAEGRLVAEAGATRNLGGDANAAAAHNLGDDTNITAAKNLGEDAHAAAAYNPGEDANAAAAKEKAEITGDVPRSQNNKNEKINEGDGEIRKLIEEEDTLRKETDTN